MREKKEINVQIGLQVRKARENANMTQEGLAERLDRSPQYVSDLERGVVGLSVPTLKNLCLILGASSDSILFAAEDKRNLDALADKCRILSDEQFRLLMGIVSNFIEAVSSK